MEELKSRAVFAGRYEIISRLSTSHMAHVYTAYDSRDVGIQIILKIVLDIHDPVVLARAYMEAGVLQRLNHPNIPRCRGIFQHEGILYLVIEFRMGQTLADALKRGTPELSLRRRLIIALELCNTLQYLHEQGIAHRDLKPQNIILTIENGRPRVTLIDFGLARTTNQGREEIPDELFVGTPMYMAPESLCTGVMVSGEDLLPADRFSLGVLLTELLTGTHPFQEYNIDMIRVSMGARVPIFINSDEEALIELLASMMSYDPTDRLVLPVIAATLAKMLDELPSSSRRFIAGEWRHLGEVTESSTHPTRPGLPLVNEP